MTLPVIQNSLIAGELAPSFWGRTDKPQYKNGASTMRNCFVRYTGGSSSRAGLAYVGMCKQGAPNAGGTLTSFAPRDINFQYDINQGFVLEFGDQYMRVKTQGAYVTENTKNISSITRANPAVFTVTGHGYNNGDWIFIQNAGGMTNFNGLTWIVTNKTTNTFQVTDLFGSTVNSTAFPAYTSGGTTARIYTAVSPYAAVDLPYLKFTQSANTMNLACWNQQTNTEYPPYNLQRISNTDWTFTQVTFASVIAPPSNFSNSLTSSTTQNTWYAYVVTSIDNDGNESVASTIQYIFNNDIAVNAGSNILNWLAVTDAVQYNIYAATPAFTVSPFVNPGFIGASFGLIGTAFGGQFIDTNIVPDFTRSPPQHINPFARGTIEDVVVTSPGSGFTSSNISYTINTSTGSGAILTPFALNGGLAGFIVKDGGQGYAPGDTITISGGSIQATGNLTFGTNPSDGENIVLNGVTWTFTSSPPSGNQTLIGTTLAQTLSYLGADLNASVNGSIDVANYSVSGTQLFITYKTGGTAGNAYTLSGGTAGATPSSAALTGGSGSGSGAAATLSIGPQTGTYPGTVQYYQQRLVYADSINQPDTYNMSQPGLYSNFDSSIPVVDSDAITGTPWGVQINGIQFMVPTISGLLTFTGNGVWLISGGNNVAITPSDQNAQAQAQVGCSAIVPPLLVNLHVLYVQSKNSIVRDIAYNFLYNVFQGTDITLWSNHLFQNYSLLQWVYAEEPFKVIWAVRNDGVLLSLTYVKEQEIEGWARHDTNGLFVGVCSITEKHQSDVNTTTRFGALTDAVYVVTQRYILGHDVWVYYSERMDDRNWFNVEDCICVDACLTYSMAFPQATLSPVAANGTNNITSTIQINGGSGYTAPTAIAVDSTGRGTGAAFSVSVSGGVITAITPTSGGNNYVAGATQVIIADSTGSGAIFQPVITNYVTFNASTSVFSSGMIGDVIRAGGGKATIVTYNSGTQVVADITQPIVAIIPNDPNFMPVPIVAGEWSVSTPTSVVNGLNHLEGMIVTGLADGGVITPVEVVNGSITLSQPASSIVVGLPFTAQVQTMPLEMPSQVTTMGKRKNASSSILILEASRGLQVGANQLDQSMIPDSVGITPNSPIWTNLDEMKQRNMFVNAGSAIPLFSGISEPINITSDWNQRGQIAIQQSYPLPMNLLACVSEFSVGDNSG